MFALSARRSNDILARSANARTLAALSGGAAERRTQRHASSSSSDGESVGDAPKAVRPKRRLDVAIVGAPNAGKSQLLNSLIGSKVAAVSRKRHTTRSGILGALTVDDSQLVFVDTPGFLHHARARGEGVRELLSAASSEMGACDFSLVVIDAARRIDDDLRRTLAALMLLSLRAEGRREVLWDGEGTGEKGPPEPRGTDEKTTRDKFAVVLNKVDLVTPKEQLLVLASDIGAMAECCLRHDLRRRRDPSSAGRLGDTVVAVLDEYQDQHEFEGVHDDDVETFAALAPEFFFSSAKTRGDGGVEDVLALLFDRATPSRQWIANPERPTGMSPVERVEEIVREKLYRCTHREVPHSIDQQNRSFQKYVRRGDDGEADGVGIRIEQILVVRTESHRRLVVGTGARTLERIRSTAERDLAEVFGCEVQLRLHVKRTKSNRDVPLEQEQSGVVFPGEE